MLADQPGCRRGQDVTNCCRALLCSGVLLDLRKGKYSFLDFCLGVSVAASFPQQVKNFSQFNHGKFLSHENGGEAEREQRGKHAGECRLLGSSAERYRGTALLGPLTILGDNQDMEEPVAPAPPETLSTSCSMGNSDVLK